MHIDQYNRAIINFLKEFAYYATFFTVSLFMYSFIIQNFLNYMVNFSACLALSFPLSIFGTVLFAVSSYVKKKT